MYLIASEGKHCPVKKKTHIIWNTFTTHFLLLNHVPSPVFLNPFRLELAKVSRHVKVESREQAHQDYDDVEPHLACPARSGTTTFPNQIIVSVFLIGAALECLCERSRTLGVCVFRAVTTPLATPLLSCCCLLMRCCAPAKHTQRSLHTGYSPSTTYTANRQQA